MLQVGVPELEDWIIERTRHYEPALVSTDPGFRHAHITVLAPIARWDMAAIAQIAASTAPFDFTLARTGLTPSGWINLWPEPDAPLRTLTQRAMAAHPDVVPFGDPRPMPHLTLDKTGPGVSLASTTDAIAGLLPLYCQAEALELVWYGMNDCHLIERWALTGADQFTPTK